MSADSDMGTMGWPDGDTSDSRAVDGWGRENMLSKKGEARVRRNLEVGKSEPSAERRTTSANLFMVIGLRGWLCTGST